MLNFLRVISFGLICIVSLATGSSPSSAADAYPNRPVHWLIGFAPGGPVDIVARIMSQWLSDRLGQQFIVENRTGSGGNIAAAARASGKPRRVFFELMRKHGMGGGQAAAKTLPQDIQAAP